MVPENYLMQDWVTCVLHSPNVLVFKIFFYCCFAKFFKSFPGVLLITATTVRWLIENYTTYLSFGDTMKYIL